jgi:hypothetical protein
MVGSSNSLSVDGAGGLHVSYFDVNNLDLAYAFKAPGGSWQLERVDGECSWAGQYTALALDETGGIHIAYQNDGSPHRLFHAVRLP